MLAVSGIVLHGVVLMYRGNSTFTGHWAIISIACSPFSPNKILTIHISLIHFNINLLISHFSGCFPIICFPYSIYMSLDLTSLFNHQIRKQRNRLYYQLFQQPTHSNSESVLTVNSPVQRLLCYMTSQHLNTLCIPSVRYPFPWMQHEYNLKSTLVFYNRRYEQLSRFNTGRNRNEKNKLIIWKRPAWLTPCALWPDYSLEMSLFRMC
jgi:hypothetical protein